MFCFILWNSWKYCITNLLSHFSPQNILKGLLRPNCSYLSETKIMIFLDVIRSCSISRNQFHFCRLRCKFVVRLVFTMHVDFSSEFRENLLKIFLLPMTSNIPSNIFCILKKCHNMHSNVCIWLKTSLTIYCVTFPYTYYLQKRTYSHLFGDH